MLTGVRKALIQTDGYERRQVRTGRPKVLAWTDDLDTDMTRSVGVWHTPGVRDTPTPAPLVAFMSFRLDFVFFL